LNQILNFKKMKVKITTLLVACLFFAVSLKSQTIRIGIASDLHYFDQSLLIANGTAFQTYIMMDRKLIAESHAITRSMIDSFKTQNLNIVLITGDLTKDGEKSSHQKLAAMFQELEDAGTKVFVVPGNHDINNPEAFSYDGSKTNVVATVTPQEFISIYGNFGYNEAIYKDSGSLTYIAEPVNGLWILGIDDCKYKNNATLGHSETAGDLSRETRTWIAMKLNEAREKNIKVIGLIHHGILEHFTGQKSMFSEYVIDNYDSISNDLGAHGLSVVFSGHFHAHDARVKNLGNKDICDVETGSSVTYPCPYRIAELKTDNKLYITSKRITKITYNTGSKTFQEYALDYIKTGLPVLVKYMLIPNR
jgi:3',5'-cyclic AMP phosphodiesterase CpdA